MTLLLYALDLLVIAAHMFLRNKLGFFDLDAEGNLASLYSGAKLWTIATLTLGHAAILFRVRAPRRHAIAFFLFALGVAYIGLDDMMGVHERMGFVLNNLFGTGGFYGESFNWLFYFAPFMIAACAVFIAVIRFLWRMERTAAWWFVAGVTLWIASIGTEFLGRYFILQTTVNVPAYHILIVIEEALEIFGATALFTALFRATRGAIRRHVRVVE